MVLVPATVHDWGAPQQPLSPRRPVSKPPAEPDTSVNLWLVIKNRIWLILTIMVACVSLALLYTKKQAKTYRASVTLEIQDTNNDLLNTRDLDPHAASATLSSETYMMTQVELMRSNSLLTRVLTRILLDRQVSAMGRPQTPLVIWGVTDAAGPESLQRMVARAKANIQARVINNTRVVELTGEAEDPVFIADFLNLLAKEYKNRGLEVRGAAGRLNNTRLGAELEGLRNKLQISEQRLRDYAKQTGLMITEEKENLAEQKLRQVQEELSRAQAARVSKQALYEITSGATPDSLPQALNDSAMREYQSKISELQRQYADQSVSLTPEHPAVQRLQAQLNELRTARDRHLSRVVESIKNDYESAVPPRASPHHRLRLAVLGRARPGAQSHQLPDAQARSRHQPRPLRFDSPEGERVRHRQRYAHLERRHRGRSHAARVPLSPIAPHQSGHRPAGRRSARLRQRAAARTQRFEPP